MENYVISNLVIFVFKLILYNDKINEYAIGDTNGTNKKYI
jgi:hypothetical protein